MDAETKKHRLYAFIASVALVGTLWVVKLSTDRLIRASDPARNPISKTTDIGGRPARYDDKAKEWVLTDEKDLTVIEEDK